MCAHVQVPARFQPSNFWLLRTMPWLTHTASSAAVVLLFHTNQSQLTSYLCTTVPLRPGRTVPSYSPAVLELLQQKLDRRDGLRPKCLRLSTTAALRAAR